MELYDIIFLIGSYLTIADGEINDKEHKILLELCSPSEDAIHQQSLIYSDSDDKIQLNELIDKYLALASRNDNILLDVLFQVEYADDYPSSYEEELISLVSRQLKIPESKIAECRQKYDKTEKGVLADLKLTWAESLSAAFNTLITELNGDNDDDYSELLSGKAFAKKLRDIAKISELDLNIAEDIMNQYNNRIQIDAESIGKNIKRLEDRKRNDKEIEELVGELIKTNEWIREDVSQALYDNLQVLEKKKRNINYFTIAFMGRTKAGKSTFHKVVTHEENDDIGVGRLRTTRFNRSFYWENIRIVDTPGIGAPGGKNDTEIANSIIDEADLICYIVTDDSIQTTEFDFLRPLKERSKPLFIILNIKGDLDHPKRLSKFINDPLKWRNDKGKDDIQGHYDRISEALGDKYDMSMVEIIPLQLQAAILMNLPDRFSLEEKEQLLLGSNIKEYVQKVKKSIYRTGSLKKTQNIYDGCAYQINQVKSGLEVRYASILHSIQIVSKTLNNIMAFIDNESEKSEQRIEKTISNAFQQMQNNAHRFAEKYYEHKGDLSSKWNNDPDNKRINTNLSNTLKQISSDFSESVQNRINECLSDIQIQFDNRYDSNNKQRITGASIINFQLGVGIAGSLASLAAGIFGKTILIALGFSNPAVWMITALVAAVGAITWGVKKIFKSRDQQIAEAKEKILSPLLDSINENEARIYDEYLGQFTNNVNAIKNQLNDSFNLVSEQSQIIADYLKNIIDYSEEKENILTTLFAYRILRYLRVIPKLESENNIDLKLIRKSISVNRSYQESLFKINKPSGIPSDMLDLATHVTQIKITN